jgi:hypothetical protein
MSFNLRLNLEGRKRNSESDRWSLKKKLDSSYYDAIKVNFSHLRITIKQVVKELLLHAFEYKNKLIL